MTFTLEPYQTRLCDLALESMLKGEAPCVVSPTGSGKSVVLAEIARRLRTLGQPVLLLAHRTVIVKQLRKTCFHHCGEDVGLFTRNESTENFSIVSAMVPLLTCRPGAVEALRGRAVLLDEGHHIHAPSYQKVIKGLAPAVFCAATATPVTPSGAGLGPSGITSLLLGPSPSFLMSTKMLCQYELFAAQHAVVDTGGIPSLGGDFNGKILKERVYQVQGDFLRDLLLYNPTLEPTITVTINVEHANAIAEHYNENGVSARVVVGKTPEREREKAFGDFAKKELNVIVSVAVVDEGLDLPEATCLQLVRLTKSLRLWKQLCGRVLRRDLARPDKKAIIIVHGDTWKILPFPHEDVPWSLKGKTKFCAGHRRLSSQGKVLPVEPTQTLVRAGGENLSRIRIDLPRGPNDHLNARERGELEMMTTPKRQKAFNKALYLVQRKGFNPAILREYARDDADLLPGQSDLARQLMGLPCGGPGWRR